MPIRKPSKFKIERKKNTQLLGGPRATSKKTIASNNTFSDSAGVERGYQPTKRWKQEMSNSSKWKFTGGFPRKTTIKNKRK